MYVNMCACVHAQTTTYTIRAKETEQTREEENKEERGQRQKKSYERL
jgi:hypothetical protein